MTTVAIMLLAVWQRSDRFVYYGPLSFLGKAKGINVLPCSAGTTVVPNLTGHLRLGVSGIS